MGISTDTKEEGSLVMVRAGRGMAWGWGYWRWKRKRVAVYGVRLVFHTFHGWQPSAFSTFLHAPPIRIEHDPHVVAHSLLNHT
jgi:hypothetical protein